MIRKVTLRRFKCFDDVTFEFPGHIVLAGPNNCGKTTVLQAIAAWSLALERWKQEADFQRHGGAYTKVPIARQALHAVPLRAFDLLWNQRRHQGTIDVGIEGTRGWNVTMELVADSTEQVYVRPKRDVEPAVLRQAALPVAYVPAMTGLSTAEPVYRRPKLDQLLGQGKPGDVLRNLLVEAHSIEPAWKALARSILELFGYEILPPDASGADIMAEYRALPNGPRFDIANAGSGFQQVLMLLTFLHTRPASVLLLDEPDAHLHVLLQDSIYGELRSVAARQGSQLVLATHSEVIINSVEPRELCMVLARPRLLSDAAERTKLAESLGALTQIDVAQALDAPGVLYLEDYTDLAILREWARLLRHAAHETLTTKLFWKKSVWEPRPGAAGIKAKDHYDFLRLVRPDLRGLVLLDGDANPNIGPTEITGEGLQRLRWRRYEIESYLVHPDVLERFVEKTIGSPQAARVHVADLRKHLEAEYPKGVLSDALGDHAFLRNTKARTELLPPALTAAGLPGIPYTSYHEIAALMKPEEIHPEVREKLDAIQKAIGL